ncbi:MAG: hypothetical protein D6696_14290 [Acidobacteria bacterium]|nr:MAG: hypothetical protein D6696_14290 [Acidobacteriota bacterium]
MVPTRHGEQAVMRLARGAGRRRFDDLGLPAGVAERLRRLLGRPEGLLVVTGPTGSGKTTTLYAALEHLHESRGDRVRLASIEDPVEVDLPFIAQTEVDRARGVGFAEGLRAVLRQDPNVLMIGEIRDPETAAIAVQAGLTGHLVLTTVHADGAAGVMNRLLDAGVEPYRAASSVLACLAQRLVPRLCPACRRPAELDPRLAGRLANLGLAVADRSFYRAPGCDACGGSGQGGRLALFELLEMTPELRQLVVDKVPSQRLRDAAVAAGMTSLAQAALDAAAAGDVDLDHALEVIG